jgi:predicted dienelactone hydrolase
MPVKMSLFRLLARGIRGKPQSRNFVDCRFQLPCLIAIAILVLLVFLPFSAAAQTSYNPAQLEKLYQVETIKYEWLDAKRSRFVPVKIYYPVTEGKVLPVIIFSHGLGGSRDGYEYLGRHWASRGYVSVHLQHLGSDDAVWRQSSQIMQSLKEAAAGVENAVHRPLDVSFAIDQLEILNREAAPLKGKLDLTRIGVAGHSFGGFTVMAVIGQVFVTKAGNEFSLADKRIKAAIAMSAPVPRNADLKKSFGSIKIPCLHMTGTLDQSLVSDVKPEERRLPYDNINSAEQYLLTLQGGDHMVFAGVRVNKDKGKKDPIFHELICQVTTAFWDATLQNNVSARNWLWQKDGFEKVLGQNGTWERKM